MQKAKVRIMDLALCLALGTMLLAACGDSTPTVSQTQTTQATTAAATATSTATSAVPTVTPGQTATTAPSTTTQTTAATTTTAAPTTAPTTAPATTAVASVQANAVTVGKDLYIDDRSDAVDLLRSFYNAINRRELVRAYSYWNVPGTGPNGKPMPYAQFEQGYKDTTNVDLSIGPVSSGAAAGTVYTQVPVTLKATSTNNAVQTFAGCYTVRQPQPANFGIPPFTPMLIDSGNVQAVTAGSDPGQLMAKSCQNPDLLAGAAPYTPTPAPTTIDASVFIDNRSTPEDVLHSYYNAINRKEYVRAYSYWMHLGTAELPPAYPQFVQGYQDTASVQLTLGKFTSQGAAGSIYSDVPFTLVAKLTNNQTKNFVGCYTVRLVQPSIYTEPPLEPMGIYNAKVKEVPAGTQVTMPTSQDCH